MKKIARVAIAVGALIPGIIIGAALTGTAAAGDGPSPEPTTTRYQTVSPMPGMTATRKPVHPVPKPPRTVRKSGTVVVCR